jgi:hypothetical protein
MPLIVPSPSGKRECGYNAKDYLLREAQRPAMAEEKTGDISTRRMDLSNL